MQPWAPPPPAPPPPRAGEAPAPVAESERRPMVDVLRAVALLGVVVVNVAAYRRGVGPNLAAAGGRVGGGVDPLTVTLSALAEGRFYPLFSFLFGWGLAVQDARARARGRSVVGPWLRRCGVLLVLGAAHALLLFDGDILTTYAVLGVGLLLVRPLRPGWLAALGATLVVLQGLFTTGLVTLATAFSDPEGLGVTRLRSDVLADLAADARTYGGGSFGDVLALRAGHLATDYPLGLLTVGGTVAGMMCLGMAAARVGWVDPGRWPGWLHRAMVPLWVVGLALSVPAAWLVGDTALGTLDVGRAALSWALYSLLGPAVALAWAGAVLRAGEVPALRRALGLLAPAGRMTLTLYLSQSLLASFAFNGYGLDLGDRLGIGAAVALSVGIWLVQVVLATLWLKAFTMGPVEALARAAAYLRWPSVRRRAEPSPLAAVPGGR
ncbi:DUF418 domain-containing protein [Iamia majanohamensis]|uniref:DUF418 domain-containing protein n=1 Tax=Iamia majanohamensis TaxID=467976 RepID=A0AAE9Y9L4_9ACTN|nr:DUF418 domain-containing protein [Iamia majanohamensis]WCO67153.1 DUF418 domain-containing protein [Iamia majanohamensis]